MLRHQRARVFVSSLLFQSRPAAGQRQPQRDAEIAASQRDAEIAASSAEKGMASQPRPRQPQGPLRASLTPGHGARWLHPGPRCAAGRAAGGDAPGSGPAAIGAGGGRDGRLCGDAVLAGTPLRLQCRKLSSPGWAGAPAATVFHGAPKSGKEQSGDALPPAPAAAPAARHRRNPCERSAQMRARLCSTHPPEPFSSSSSPTSPLPRCTGLSAIFLPCACSSDACNNSSWRVRFRL